VENSTTLTVTVPATDPHYADGALVRLTGLSGTQVEKVEAVDENGEALVNELIAGDGAVFLRLPGLTRGKRATVKWTFLAPEGKHLITAALFPLPLFQSAGMRAPDDTKVMELEGGGEVTVVSRRAIVVELTGGSRLVNEGEAAEMRFRISLDSGTLGEGESVTVKVKEKTGTGPGDDSYTTLAVSPVTAWTCAQEGGALAGTLDLSAMSPGTYRIYFELRGADGALLAQSPFNFIVR